MHHARVFTGRRMRSTVALPLLVLASLDGHPARRSVIAATRGPVAQRAERVARPTVGRTTVVTVTVPATAPWTDTGITLYTGDTLQIRAWGQATFDNASAKRASPKGSGRPAGGCTFVVTNAGVPSDGLVANLAAGVVLDGKGFFVGPSWSGMVPVPGTSTTDGRLLLGVNGDGVLCDRSGYDAWRFGVNRSGFFTAEIAITRRAD